MAVANVQFGPNPAAWVGIHSFFVPASLEGEKLEAVQTLLQWIMENQAHWATSGQVPALLSVQASLDAEKFPSNIVLGASFSDYGFLDFTSTVTQEMYQIGLDPELDAQPSIIRRQLRKRLTTLPSVCRRYSIAPE